MNYEKEAKEYREETKWSTEQFTKLVPTGINSDYEKVYKFAADFAQQIIETARFDSEGNVLEEPDKDLFGYGKLNTDKYLEAVNKYQQTKTVKELIEELKQYKDKYGNL